MLSNGLRQLDLEVNDDVYWGLTRLGAEKILTVAVQSLSNGMKKIAV